MDVTGPGAINASTRGSRAISGETVYVKNSLGRDLSRFSAVLIGPTTDLPTGENDPVFNLINPSLQNLVNRTGRAFTVGILPEPIANNRTGLAQISGVTPARFNETEQPAGTPVLFAHMSDRNDMLVASSSGPISVLSTATILNSTSRLLWVRLGQEDSLAAGFLNYSIPTWNANPSSVFSYGTGCTYTNFSDALRLGLYSSHTSGSAPAGKLRIARNGRFFINVDWNIAPKNTNSLPSAGDRFEYVVNWGGLIADFGSISYSAWSGASELSAGLNWSITGNRVFAVNQQTNMDASFGYEIVIPGVTVKRLNSSGVVQSTLELQGDGQIYVACMGPQTSGINPWTTTQKNTVWARTNTGGPI